MLLGAAFSANARAQVDVGRDLLGENLFPPDLILRQADEIALTNSQRGAVTNLIREMKKTITEGRGKITSASDQLRESLKSAAVPESAIVDQFSGVLDIEKEIKRGQFAMLVRAKNLLTPEQQDKLREIVRKQPRKANDRKLPPIEPSSTDVRRTLDARMELVQAGIEKWRNEGRDPTPVLEIMKGFADQMQAGKHAEAKETLTRALRLLDEPKRR